VSTSLAQFQFAAEFIAFLAAAAGLALVLLRSDLLTRSPWAETVLALGFGALLTAAFLHGSLLIGESSRATITVLRGFGIVAVAAGSMTWRGSAVTQRMLWLSLALAGLDVVLIAAGHRLAADAVLGLGAAILGTALLDVSRASIAARVAASAAGSLLLLVLVLSVALSAVLSRSAEREAVQRLEDSMKTESSLASESATRNSLQNAAYAASFLVARQGDALITIANQDPNVPAEAVDETKRELVGLTSLFPGVGLAYLLPTGAVLAADKVEEVVVTELAGSALVEQTQCPKQVRSSVVVVKQQAFAVAAYPECTARSAGLLGRVLAVLPLDNAYLDLRAGDNGPSIALLSRTAQLAASTQGKQPAAAVARRLANAALDDPSRRASAITDTRFVVARPVFASDRTPVLALVGSTPTSSVAATRDALFRTLFLIALGGTLLALLLAAVVGDRIGSGLRRLTSAAESIRRGELGVRAGIQSEDEVGVLGAAFDSMVVSIEDKTSALRQAADDEAALRNRLVAVVAGMGDALVAVDAGGHITDFNRAAEELTGVTAADARQVPVDEVLSIMGEDGTDLGARLRTPSPARWAAIATVAGGNGARVPVAVSAGALRGPDSQLAGNVLVLRDLRRERQLERMKSEFLARAGHELRTPLTPIVGYAESLLRYEMDPARRRTALLEIVQSAKRLLRTVQILEFVATAEAGRMLLRPEPLDVRGVIGDVAERWSARAPSHVVVRKVSRRLPAVMGDRRWLARALDELMDNATKFSPQGGRIVVSASRAEGAKGAGVEITVSDPGKGMTDEEQAQCFGDFVQGDASDTRSFGGLGLGLGLVKRVAEGHGGEVRCQSELNQGSRFTILLPGSGEQ